MYISLSFSLSLSSLRLTLPVCVSLLLSLDLPPYSFLSFFAPSLLEHFRPAVSSNSIPVAVPLSAGSRTTADSKSLG